MQELSNFTATLNHFVQLFDLQNDHGYKKGGKAPGSSCSDTDAIADDTNDAGFHVKQPWNAGPSQLTVLFDLADKRASMYQSDQHQVCVRALIDSVIEQNGLLSTSYAEVVADYLPSLGELDVAELNRARTFLLHSGPVLGLGSRTSAELKWVVARHFAVGEFKRDDEAQNQNLAKCFNRLLEDSKKLEVELAPLLVELSRVIYEEGKAYRQLTAVKVERLLKCSSEEAKCLCRIYNALPNTPL